MVIFFRLLLSNCLNWKIYCDDHSSLHLQAQYKYEIFHIYFTSLHCTGKYELNKLTSLPMCGFIAQLVEHRTGIAEVTGSNPAEALIFFRLLLSNCLNWKIYCDDHSSLHLQAQYKYELFHIYFTSLHCTGKYELNKLTSLPMCGFIAQLVEHRTGIAEVTGSNPVAALIFFFFFFFQASSFQLFKLENLLRWSFFTSSTSAVQIWIISYISASQKFSRYQHFH